jgi:hypothetical protein
MKRRNLAAFAAAYILALIGCFNPLSPPGEAVRGGAAAGDAQADGSGQEEPDSRPAGITGEDFALTLAVSVAGEGRAITTPSGAGTGTIQYGSIRNVAQVIAADAAGKIVAFHQVCRDSGNANGATLTVSVPPGVYHFLVLMGYRPYSGESTGTYTGYSPTAAPTLLAAGFTTAAVTADTAGVPVTMKSVVVDTAFGYGGVETGAMLPSTAHPDGVTLPRWERAPRQALPGKLRGDSPR